MARILSDSGSQGLSPGGGIPTPNWDALADIDAVGGVTRADVVPRVVQRLTSEALNEEVECQWWLLFTYLELIILLVVLCSPFLAFVFLLAGSDNTSKTAS